MIISRSVQIAANPCPACLVIIVLLNILAWRIFFCLKAFLAKRNAFQFFCWNCPHISSDRAANMLTTPRWSDGILNKCGGVLQTGSPTLAELMASGLEIQVGICLTHLPGAAGWLSWSGRTNLTYFTHFQAFKNNLQDSYLPCTISSGSLIFTARRAQWCLYWIWGELYDLHSYPPTNFSLVLKLHSPETPGSDDWLMSFKLQALGPIPPPGLQPESFFC